MRALASMTDTTEAVIKIPKIHSLYLCGASLRNMLDLSKPAQDTLGGQGEFVEPDPGGIMDRPGNCRGKRQEG
jgi:hypothetical protein